jgi:hypothetical protein
MPGYGPVFVHDLKPDAWMGGAVFKEKCCPFFFFYGIFGHVSFPFVLSFQCQNRDIILSVSDTKR